MRCKRKDTARFSGLLLSLPWHASFLLGEFIFVALKWIFPALAPSHTDTHMVALALANLAWLFSGIFLLAGAALLVSQKPQWLTSWRPTASHPPGLWPHR